MFAQVITVDYFNKVYIFIKKNSYTLANVIIKNELERTFYKSLNPQALWLASKRKAKHINTHKKIK